MLNLAQYLRFTSGSTTRQSASRILAACVVFLIAASCSKIGETPSSIRGVALDLTDNSPLAGYTIRLVETETPPKPFTPLIVTTIATTETDAEGKFNFDEELSMRPGKEYHAVFDPGQHSFMQESWEAEDGSKVVGKVRVEVGKPNFVHLLQAPKGEVQLIVQNNTGEDVFFEVLKHHALASSRGFYDTVPSGETTANGMYLSMPTGEIELEIIATGNGNSDTLHQDIILAHDEMKDVLVVYE